MEKRLHQGAICWRGFRGRTWGTYRIANKGKNCYIRLLFLTFRSEEHTSELQSLTKLFPYTTLFRSRRSSESESIAGIAGVRSDQRQESKLSVRLWKRGFTKEQSVGEDSEEEPGELTG